MEGQCKERPGVEGRKEEVVKPRNKWQRLVHSRPTTRGDMTTEENTGKKHDESHFVNVVSLDDPVEAGVEVVEQLDDVHGTELGRQPREADDVAEVDGHAVVALWRHRLAVLQLLND